MTKKHIKKKKSCYFRIFLKIITNNIKSAREVFSEHINLVFKFILHLGLQTVVLADAIISFSIIFFKGASYSIEYRKKNRWLDGRIIGSKFGSYSCEICFHDGK